MFVVPLKASKLKWWVIGCAAVIGLILLWSSQGKSSELASSEVCFGTTAEQREEFLTAKGWEFQMDPVEICEIVIPYEFNQVYEEYQALQLSQGFDLSKYKGKKVKRWKYQVTNYPNQAEHVYATLLIYEGKIIGGDVTVEESGGTQQGLDCLLVQNKR